MKMSLIYSFLFTSFLAIPLLVSTKPERSSYIVHMDKSVMPKVFTDHRQWHSSTLGSLNSQNPEITTDSRTRPQVIYSYDNALHGFSAMLSEVELETLKKATGFVSAYPDRKVTLRTTHTPDFLSLTPTGGIWPVSNYGKDVIIGVVDTGVWPESASFNDAGMTPVPATWKGFCEEGQEFNSSMCNNKLIGARYFNKGLLAANPGLNLSMNSARDTSSHGTHCASTAAGNYVEGASFFGYAKGTAKGIAPRARVAVYKIEWSEGTANADMLAGIDQAVADGVNVLSLSFGFDEDLPWYENPIAISCFGAMEKGIIVSHAGGNTGFFKPYSLFDSMPWTVTVAAGSIDRSFAGKLTLGNGVSFDGWTLFPASALVEKLPLIYNKTLASCSSVDLLAQFPANSVIICEKTNSTRFQLEQVAASRSVAAAIFISNLTEDISRVKDFPWPGVVVTPNEGASVINYATTSSNPTASIRFQQTILGIKPAPAVSSYSSRGPSRTYPGLLKPDLMAPGTLVLAAVTPNHGHARIGSLMAMSADYNMISGTSMAAPHVAGVAAMLRASHKNWSPASIKSAMMTTANTLDNTNNLISDNGNPNFTYASVLAVGSGHIDPNRAVDPGLVYDTTPQDYVNLMCYLGYTKEQLLTVTRSGSYNCSNPSGDLNYPSFISIYGNTNTTTRVVQTFERTVTNVGNATSRYVVEVIEPAGSKVKVVPEELVFGEVYEKQKYTLTIEYVIEKNGMTTEGSLVWVGEGGKYRVRSPIVIAPSMNN